MTELVVAFGAACVALSVAVATIPSEIWINGHTYGRCLMWHEYPLPPEKPDVPRDVAVRQP